MDQHCNTRFNVFCDVYVQYLPAGIRERMNEKEDAVSQLDFFCEECAKAGRKIFLFIDEYDHFTNDILSDPDRLKGNDSERVRSSVGHTVLHKIVIVYRGMEMVVCEEV